MIHIFNDLKLILLKKLFRLNDCQQVQTLMIKILLVRK